ncbi:cation:proton antiporter [Defluviitalea saccharophila]|uniref:Cation:proton antiporter n=1 Tax=Defluviitalea saccharophila TaxID=879970 RepID=A0ABZ2Y3R3_9FIRM|nr:cation:proton antiporter [Candidatus Epulonipiscium sp.]
MMSTHFLLDIAIILLFTKIFGLITKRFSMPQVLGALLAGLILGPAGIDLLHETEFLSSVAELGVIVLMFSAGLETDLKELRKSGKASLIIAIIGVIVPLLGGALVSFIFNKNILQDIFIGVILTATSVSITVETLQEMGKLKTESGTAILGAAVIDDILGIIALTLVTSTATPNAPNIFIVLLKILGFFAVCIVAGLLFYYLFQWLSQHEGKKRRIPIFSLAFCLVLSYLAEEFGVADITGAYIAGLILCNTLQAHYIGRRVEIISYMFLSPIFFASIGIKTSIMGMDGRIILFTVLIVAVAILTKIVGCGLGAKLCGYTSKESYRIGVGMISRGEVALIVANKGAAVGLMQEAFFAPIIIMVIITTLVTPIWLKFAYRH